MSPHIKQVYRSLAGVARLLRDDVHGQIAIMLAVSSIAVLLAVGAGIDLARAYSAQLKLSEVATLACQYSTRPSVIRTATGSYSGANGFQHLSNGGG